MLTLNELAACNLCPRACGVNRLAGQAGFCGALGREVRVARIAPHMWEEPCISGTRGSGTIFFGGCNLRCVFCQNHVISRIPRGKLYSPEALADAMLTLAASGVHNLNLVTPTHYAAQVAVALERAKRAGLSVPVVYNCGGYERVETLRALDGLVDVWLPDFKYNSKMLAADYANAPDYPAFAMAAVTEMVRQTGEPLFDADGMMVRGVLVRHLVLPGATRDAIAILTRLYQAFGDRIWFSIMRQFTPMQGTKFPELTEPLTEVAYEKVLAAAERLGITHAFVQEGAAVGASFIPHFDI